MSYYQVQYDALGHAIRATCPELRGAHKHVFRHLHGHRDSHTAFEPFSAEALENLHTHLLAQDSPPASGIARTIESELHCRRYPHTSALGFTWTLTLRRLNWALSDEVLAEGACPICRGRGYFDQWFKNRPRLHSGDPVACVPDPVAQDPVSVLYIQREECECYRSPAKQVGRLALSPRTAARLYLDGWTQLRDLIAVMADLLAVSGDRSGLWLHALIERPNDESRYPVREATEGELALLIVWRREEEARRARVLFENYELASASIRTHLHRPYFNAEPAPP